MNLARRRISESRALFRARQYSGAYYLAGYAVECSLKAAICKQFRHHTLPELKTVKNTFQHDPQNLLKHSNLADAFDQARRNDPDLGANWATIILWSEASRYVKQSRVNARDLIRAVDDGPSSFMQWMSTQWLRSIGRNA